MTDAFEELGIKKISCLLVQMIEEENELYNMLNESWLGGLEGVSNSRIGLGREPQRWNHIVDRIDCIYYECKERFCLLNSKLEPLPFSYLSKKCQKELRIMCDFFPRCMTGIRDLIRIFKECYNEYLLSGSSGNPANPGYFIEWRRRFLCSFPGIVNACREILEELKRLEWEEKLASMACVYAAPERMRVMGNADSLSENYPYNYSINKENVLDEKRMVEDII